jgi:hypothetical protein
MNKETSSANIKYAVGVFMWRRDAHLTLILEAIKQYGPSKLYLFVDGARSEEDQVGINQVLNTCESVLQDVLFEVVYDIAPNHMGLNRRFRTGIHRLFSAEACAIVLEDDTIPALSFFEYCNYYLSACFDNNDIVAINGYFKMGTSFVKENNLKGPFTHYIFNPWGWASWGHKILPLYNPDIQSVNIWQSLRVFSLWWNLDVYRLRRKLLRNIELGILNTWDVQLQWSIFLARKKVLTTPINLVSNVGNDALATTFIAGSTDFNQPVGELSANFYLAKIRHLPSYDYILCRSKTNRVFIKKQVRKVVDNFFFEIKK